MDAKVIERFNRLQQCFGRLEILWIGLREIIFRQGFRKYEINMYGVLEEFKADHYGSTEHSKWIDAIASGGVRNDSGEITIPEVAKC